MQQERTTQRKTQQLKSRLLQVLAGMLAILIIALACRPMKPAQAAKTAKETYSWGTVWSDGSLSLKNTSEGCVDLKSVREYDKKSEITVIYCEQNTKFPKKCASIFRGYDNVEIINLENGDFSEIDSTQCSFMFAGLSKIRKLVLPTSFKSMNALYMLSNFENGWARDDETGARISGSGSTATFTNSGKHTYYRRRVQITGDFSCAGKIQYNGTAVIRCTSSNCAADNRKYEWYRAGVLMTNVTGNSYKFTQEDIGKSFVCYVSGKTYDIKGNIKIEIGTVAKQDKPNKPQNLESVSPSRMGASDGKISGVNTSMEYRKQGESTWKKCTGTEITGLSAGIYAVRYAEIATRYASDAQGIKVQDGPAMLVLDAKGKLTIYGPVPKKDYLNFVEKEKVTSIVASDNAVLPQDCSELFKAFYNCVSIDLTKVDTSKVTDMSFMFERCRSLKSLDVSKFNTANVTNMKGMFSECESLTSLDVSKFNTANVTDMCLMFSECKSLTSLDVTNFNTTKVTNMGNMFDYCKSLTSLDVTNFNTANVIDMYGMFKNCTSLTSLDVTKFNTANVTDMGSMFFYCTSLTSLDVTKFNTANVTSMSGMFDCCTSLTSLDVSRFNTANVTSMNAMFSNCKSLKKLDVSKFNTSKVQDMTYMFWGCEFLESLDVSNFDTANVESMRGMLGACYRVKSLDVSKFNTVKVTNMSQMFDASCSLTSLDVTKFNTANVTDMHEMFAGCRSLKSLDVSKFNTANVTNMKEMFLSCEALTSLNVSKFNTAKVKDMRKMFSYCSMLSGLDLSSFTISDETLTDEMLKELSIQHLTLGKNIKKIDKGCELTNGKSGWYCGDNEAVRVSGDAEYAVFTNNGKNTYHRKVYLEGSMYLSYSGLVYGHKITAHPETNDCPVGRLAYQWKRGETDIPGATASTYTLGKDDIGKTISCVVTDKLGVFKGSLSESTTETVEKEHGPSEPKGLVAIAASSPDAADGMITGVTTAMEYSTEYPFRNGKACTGTKITGLKPGYYYVRYAETPTTKAGAYTATIIRAYGTPVTDVFIDIKADAWYVKAVQYVYDKGIMSGKGYEFQPGTVVTREEFSQSLYNHIGKPKVSASVTNPFSDVKAGKWYTDAVLWAKDKGIVKGYGNGKFGVGDKITREQLAQMLYKYATLRGYDLTLTKNASSGYKDSNKRSEWAYTALDWAVSQGIISGKGNSGDPKSAMKLDPKGSATRAECAQMIMKLLQKNE